MKNISKSFSRLTLLVILSMIGNSLVAEEDAASLGGHNPSKLRYMFSWKFADDSNLAPRGGTTIGAPVKLTAIPTESWKSLQEDELSKFEKDRRAILAMAGDYRASFDFLETLGFYPEHKAIAPYQSWATEYIFVVEDNKDFISLQHILVMQMQQEDGALSEPYVVKHWRQDWSYEDRYLNVFLGQDTWGRETLKRSEIKGTWSQAVFQVDDSPRYDSVGKWVHAKGYSSWMSAQTWRPLPRREKSIRDDYDVLIGTNRHTITLNGWSHEQDNLKVVATSPSERSIRGRLNPDYTVRGREIGLNRYDSIEEFDFSPAIDYWSATEEFWKVIRYKWHKITSSGKTYKLVETSDGSFLMGAMMAADQIFHSEEDSKPDETDLANQLFEKFVEIQR